jgi:hypothetical protein
MNLLFYVEPLIEMGRPYWKQPWANDFCLLIINSLRKSSRGDSWKFAIAFNEPLSWKFNGDEGIHQVVFTQEELLHPFSENAYEIAKRWYEKKYSAGEMEYYKKLIQRKAGDFIPDIIIAFAPAPFLTEAFPKALLLYQEYSIFSRPPLPRSWYLDPLGMFSQSSLAKFQEQIRTQPLSGEQQKRVQSFKTRLKELILEKSPFRALISDFRKNRKYLVLLPLQFSGYYSFDSMVKYKNQYDFLEDVLRATPETIGVVVVSHPEYPVVTDETQEYLHRKYPHFIYHPAFGDYYAASQYLMAEVDGVITVSSSVAWHTLFWDKKLIDLSGGNFKIIADADRLDRVLEVLQQESQPKDGILDWIIRHYAIQEDYLRDGEWLHGYLTRSIENYRKDGITFNHFEPIAEPGALYQKLMGSLDDKIPYANHDSRSIRSLKMHIDELEKQQGMQQSKIAKLLESLLQKEGQIEDLGRQLETRRQQLQTIENMRAWRLVRKYYQLKEKLQAVMKPGNKPPAQLPVQRAKANGDTVAPPAGANRPREGS